MEDGRRSTEDLRLDLEGLEAESFGLPDEGSEDGLEALTDGHGMTEVGASDLYYGCSCCFCCYYP